MYYHVPFAQSKADANSLLSPNNTSGIQGSFITQLSRWCVFPNTKYETDREVNILNKLVYLKSITRIRRHSRKMKNTQLRFITCNAWRATHSRSMLYYTSNAVIVFNFFSLINDKLRFNTLPNDKIFYLKQIILSWTHKASHVSLNSVSHEQILIISSFKVSLPVFHGQGREHIEHFFKRITR
jgi:hypothetical protein